MAGESDQEKQVKANQANINTQLSSAQGINATAKNRFDGMKMPFDYASMAKKLNEVYSQDMGRVNSQAATDTARAGRGAAGRMANSGVTKGSLFNEAVAGAGQNIASAKYNTLGDLSKNRNANDIGLMGMENKNTMDITQNAQNVDFQNILNQFRKSGVIGDVLGLSTQNASMYDNTTWMDDAFAVANTAAQFIKPI